VHLRTWGECAVIGTNLRKVLTTSLPERLTASQAGPSALLQNQDRDCRDTHGRSSDPITEQREPVYIHLGLIGWELATGTRAYSTRFCGRWQGRKCGVPSAARTRRIQESRASARLSTPLFHLSRSAQKPLTGIVSFDNSLTTGSGAFLPGSSRREKCRRCSFLRVILTSTL